ncbi:ribosome biogenesis GTPase Der [Candidatus Fokinia crypta]|uniref:GTPase Der n=1 Tax=Candidatus Fokinia crypta TaxID=1920990 RepID=A0ABZ0UQF4_9RICK|nr:ribosome biogenesis GTPase Der [Candidatus Fokinia cryptica]WPX98112.1 GTPase Der [Candidatus Fokinia cryptica]
MIQDTTNRALAKVAIIGRPNVGKSTFFNALCRKKLAIVYDELFVTRDIRKHQVILGDLEFLLLDAPGYYSVNSKDKQELDKVVVNKCFEAIDEADIILFTMDGANYTNVIDAEIAALLYRMKKRVIVVINKSDIGGIHNVDFSQISYFDVVVSISSLHRHGFIALSEALKDLMQQCGFLPDKTIMQDDVLIQDDVSSSQRCRIAIVGRPNVGKSTLFNNLLGLQRSITSSISHTTRDTVIDEMLVTIDGVDILIQLNDTAGIRRRANIQEDIEKASVHQSISTIREVDVVIMVIDPEKLFEVQDLRIIQLCAKEKRGLIVVVNKMDLVDDVRKLREEVFSIMKEKVNTLVLPVVLFTSALYSKVVKRELSNYILAVARARKKKFATSFLNRKLMPFLSCATWKIAHNRIGRVKYIVHESDITFKVFVNKKPPLYKMQEIRNIIASKLELLGNPVNIILSISENPYVVNSKKR